MYLVYDYYHTNIFPICVCSSASDAEEMCLSLAEENYYNHCMLYLQLNHKTYQTLISIGTYNYKEVPFVG